MENSCKINKLHKLKLDYFSRRKQLILVSLDIVSFLLAGQ